MSWVKNHNGRRFLLHHTPSFGTWMLTGSTFVLPFVTMQQKEEEIIRWTESPWYRKVAQFKRRLLLSLDSQSISTTLNNWFSTCTIGTILLMIVSRHHSYDFFGTLSLWMQCSNPGLVLSLHSLRMQYSTATKLSFTNRGGSCWNFEFVKLFWKIIAC